MTCTSTSVFSLCKYGEQLCGDQSSSTAAAKAARRSFWQTEGQRRKANILSTLTAK
jgi:hypothetical protein